HTSTTPCPRSPPRLNLTRPPPPAPPLFPYTTLFRSSPPTLRSRARIRMMVATTPISAGSTSHAAVAAALPGSRLSRATCQPVHRSEEHTSELQSRENLVCRLLLE